MLTRLAAVDPLAVETIEPLLSFTLSPTMIEASERRNVIPGTCELVVDRRLLPGETPEDVEPILRELLGDARLRPRDDRALRAAPAPSSTRRSGTRSPPGSSETEPGAKLAPLCCSGFTDSHWLREAFGTVAYGFFPMRTMEMELAARLIHSADERTHVDDLGLGVDFLRAAARSLA